MISTYTFSSQVALDQKPKRHSICYFFNFRENVRSYKQYLGQGDAFVKLRTVLRTNLGYEVAMTSDFRK